MDEKTLNELLECSVCLERLDSTSKVLPCQHTFCKRCLEEILSTKKELQCPECRSYVTIAIDDLPSNILLIRLLEGMKNVTALSNPASPLHGAHSGSGRCGSATAKPIPTSSPCAKALYNYEASEQGDLRFKKGDVILLRKQVDENWYHGELDGKSGFFPATYVQILTALPQSVSPENLETPRCTALYDFAIGDKNEKDCLPFHKDDSITVIRRVDDNWAEGKMADRIGIFPISFVEMNEAAKCLMEKQSIPNLQTNSTSTTTVASRSVPTTSPSSSSSSSSSTSPTSSSSSSSSPENSPDPISDTNASVTITTTNTTLPSVLTTGVTTMVTSAVTMAMLSPTLIASQHQHPHHQHHHRIAKRHSLSFADHRLAAGHFSAANQLSVASPSHHHHHHHQRHSMEISSGSALDLSGALSSTAAISPTMVVMTTTATIGGSSVMTTVAMAAAGVSSVAMPKAGPRMSSAAGGIVIAAATSGPSSSSAAVSPSHHTAHFTMFKAQYNYKPQKEDELELRKAEFYTVTERHQDGWFKGQCIKDSKVGVFPGNYVIPVRIPAAGSKAAAAIVAAARNGTTAASPHGILTARTHFPKTTTTTASAIPRGQPPNVTVTHTRTITNVTQAQTRSIAAAARTTCTTAASPTPSAATVSASGADPCTSSGAASGPSTTGAGVSSSSSSSSGSGSSSSQVRKTVDASDVSAASTRSPHSARKHQKHRASSSSSVLSASNITITPPNVVIGAASKSPIPTAAAAAEKRDSRKKPEHRLALDKLNLMKRIGVKTSSASARKCKSPPPPPTDSAQDTASPRPTHHRTSSLPSASEVTENGAVAAAVALPSVTVPSLLKKSSDAQQSAKPAKVKPLARERFRCIAPYPAHSEMELELKHGDVVFVHKKKEDGWFRGTLQRTGKTGIFPAIFVESF